MWVFRKAESTEALFNDLCEEVRLAAPCSQLSSSLRSRLERCDPELRREICSRSQDGSPPLFTACKKGNVEIVEYLLNNCLVDVEQRGLYEVPEDRSVHTVTPLWCAAVAGKVMVVEALIKHGADVNTISDTGSTPVRSACFMTHLEVVKLLVSHNADIQRPNYNGGTCLINSVQSVELCEFLLKSGANPNVQDIQNKTALHYAIQEHRFETTKLLLRYGADPYLESRYKDDALQTACLKGAAEIIQYIVDTIPYSPERVASAFELLGSTFLDEQHDSQKALRYWRAAADLREKYGLMKPVQKPKDQYRRVREFSDRNELEAMSLDLDALRIQSLLITERILGTQHKDMIFRLMYRGAAYADSLQHQYCVDLWKYALELRVIKDSVLYCDTCFTAQALVKLYLDIYEKNCQGIIAARVSLEDVLSTTELLVRDLKACTPLLDVAPQFLRQQETYDKIIHIVMHLIYLVVQLKKDECGLASGAAKSAAAREAAIDSLDVAVRRRIHHIVHSQDPRTTTGESLLHLAVMNNNIMKSQALFEDGQYLFFPSVEVTRLLVECGAKINAMNNMANTPLHTASHPDNFCQETVEILLENGAHIDARNGESQRPLDMLKQNPESKINPLQFTSLKCLAATSIVVHNLKYKNEVPAILEGFIQAH